jgi:hypothetical protein
LRSLTMTGWTMVDCPRLTTTRSVTASTDMRWNKQSKASRATSRSKSSSRGRFD